MLRVRSRTGYEYDLSWIGWQWAVSVAILVDRPPTGRGGRMGFGGGGGGLLLGGRTA